MSTEIAVVESKHAAPTTVTAYSGGPVGQCLQLNQGWRESILMDEEQVHKMVGVMQAWLNR